MVIDRPGPGGALASVGQLGFPTIGPAQVLSEALSFFERSLAVSSSCFYWIDGKSNAAHQQLRELDATWLEAYREDFHRCDPLHPRRWRGDWGRVRTLDGMSDAQGHDARRYVEKFLMPQNTPYQAEIYFWQRDRMIAGISLLRTRLLGAFKPFEVQFIQSALPLIDLSFSLIPEVSLPDSDVLKLTPREAEIATMVAAGASNKLICRKLGIEMPTVKTHLKRIFLKVGVGSRTELISKLYLAQR